MPRVEYRPSEELRFGLEQLLEIAPPSLRRTDRSMVFAPQMRAGTDIPLEHPSLTSLRDILKKTKERYDYYMNKSDQGKLTVSLGVPAVSMLFESMFLPERTYNFGNGHLWYTRLFNDFREFVLFRLQNAKHPPVQINEHGFRYRSADWIKQSHRDATWGSLWETGIILEKRDGRVVSLSLNTPWDETAEPWYRRITPKEILIPTAAMNMMYEELSGKNVHNTQKDERMRHLQEQLDHPEGTEAWWSLAHAYIALNAWHEPGLLSPRDNFIRNTLTELEEQIYLNGEDTVFDHVKTAYGYSIWAYNRPLPGTKTMNIGYSIAFDSMGWI